MQPGGSDLPELALFGLWSSCPLTPLVALLATPLAKRKLEGSRSCFQSLGAQLQSPQEGWAGRHVELLSGVCAGGPLWLSLPQGHFRPIRADSGQGKGLQEGLEQRRLGSLGPVPALRGQGRPAYVDSSAVS